MNKKLQNTNKSPVVINITGTNGKTTTAKIIETVLTSLHYKVGLASSIGIYLNGKRIKKHDRTGPASFEFLHTRSDDLDVVICENVLRHLKIDNFYPAPSDMCLITNVEDDHLHQTRSKTLQELAQIKSKLIDRCKEDGYVVLNGDNRFTREMARKKRPKNLILFTTQHTSLKELMNLQPQIIYYLQNNSIFKIGKKDRKELIIQNLQNLPLTLDMKLDFNISNVLAATCVLDNIEEISSKKLEKELAKIKLDYSYIPGRFNLFDFKDFLVILDDAHNPKSYEEAFKTAKQIDHKRLISIIKASSTRTPQFIIKLGRIAGKNSDIIYVKESFAKNSKKRKRLGGKIAQLLKSGILKTDFPLKNIKTVLDEEKAVENAIRDARKDDLILIFGYRIDNLSKLISRLLKSNSL